MGTRTFSGNDAQQARNPYMKLNEALQIPREEYNVFDVKVFDKHGNLKEIITAEELINRPIPEPDYVADQDGEIKPPHEIES
jgi:hypothetical protein